MHDILSYLAAEYDPAAIILYGSFADGSSNLFSDFDALLITDGGERRHDDRYVDCTQLDVQICPLSEFQGDYDPAAYAQIYGGSILLDREGVAAALLEKVGQHVESLTRKAPESLDSDIRRCGKLLRRAEQADAEGAFCRHRLLTESLEVYTELRAWPYLGPKKALRQLEKRDREAFSIYEKALRAGDYPTLAEWIGHIRQRYERARKKKRT